MSIRDTRYTLAQMMESAHPIWQYAFWHSPADMPRDKLADRVPGRLDYLAKRTRCLLSVSREYHEGVANPLHASTKQRLPRAYAGGALFTRQAPCQPFESGDNVLPGMERYRSTAP